MRFVSVGAGSVVAAERVVSAAAPDSAPLKRLVQEAKEEGSAIDLTQGKKCRSVLILDNGMVVLSALEMETLTERLTKKEESL
ncbi:MAG: DUF370 domain-containing protein [Clostridia bacterium]|nr:DUF370 domain-containing protein [Clostridia bacterium]